MQTFHRQSVRLKGYDYSSGGIYFVTICTHNRQLFFNNEKIKSIVSKTWQTIPSQFINTILDEFIVMPNHIHGILCIENDGRGLIHQTQQGMINHAPTNWQMMENPKITLGKIIRYFKAKCAKNIHDHGYANFHWQRNFYEHIIRDDDELNRIREYIINNMLNWAIDSENPDNINVGV